MFEIIKLLKSSCIMVSVLLHCDVCSFSHQFTSERNHIRRLPLDAQNHCPFLLLVDLQFDMSCGSGAEGPTRNVHCAYVFSCPKKRDSPPTFFQSNVHYALTKAPSFSIFWNPILPDRNLSTYQFRASKIFSIIGFFAKKKRENFLKNRGKLFWIAISQVWIDIPLFF